MGTLNANLSIGRRNMFLTKLLSAADHPYLFGPGGRKVNNKPMAGMTAKSLKHHIALQPLFVIMGVGLVFVGPTVSGWQPRLQVLTGLRIRTLATTWATMITGNLNGSPQVVRTTQKCQIFVQNMNNYLT